MTDKSSLDKCPHCDYILVERKTYCPYCGNQLTHAPWKKIAAWAVLLLIIYGMVKCHIQMLDGFD